MVVNLTEIEAQAFHLTPRKCIAVARAAHAGKPFDLRSPSLLPPAVLVPSPLIQLPLVAPHKTSSPPRGGISYGSAVGAPTKASSAMDCNYNRRRRLLGTVAPSSVQQSASSCRVWYTATDPSRKCSGSTTR